MFVMNKKKIMRISFIICAVAIVCQLAAVVVKAQGPAEKTGLEQQSEKQTEKTSGPEDQNTGNTEKKSDEKADSAGMVADKDSKSNSLWSLFKKGGIFMWPILLCAALGMGIVIERIIFFVRTKFASREFIEKLENVISTQDLKSVEEMCVNTNNKLGGILLKGLKLELLGYERVEKTISVSASVVVASMERGLNILSAVGNIAPMLGFLGTVSGMINAFADIAAADQVSARIVAAGIMEALITTATGLIVAIPVLFCYNYFIHRIDTFVTDVERIASDVIEKLIKTREGSR
jgi:biopolymer transport protein ExbB